MKRVFIIVLDSFGIGALPDAANYGDQGSDTLAACFASGKLFVPQMQQLGLFNIQGVQVGQPCQSPAGAFGRMAERSAGKDTTTGHWELMGLVSEKPMPTYPDGFPQRIIEQLTQRTGRGVLCNRPYSGTQVIHDYGEQHLQTGDLIVYTSADSVLQIAAHEQKIPLEQLYEYCRIARKLLMGEHGVGRVIARPFTGEWPYTRTPRRHDFSIEPPKKTVLDAIVEAGKDMIAVGKIHDIFAGRGMTEFTYTTGNADGLSKTLSYADKDFTGLCFVNLVDFDMLYGHRRDVAGYAAAATEFDKFVADFIPGMREGDILMVTADHGCDPSYTKTTDHTREYVPYLICGKGVKPGVDLGTRLCFGTIAQTICDYLGVDASTLDGQSVLSDILK